MSNIYDKYKPFHEIAKLNMSDEQIEESKKWAERQIELIKQKEADNEFAEQVSECEQSGIQCDCARQCEEVG